MRNLIYFFTLITISIYGQSGIVSYQSFVIDNKEVAWLQVYHNEEKADSLSHQVFYINTSTIIRTGKWDGKVRINFKEGKYRVIIYGLHYVARQSATTSGKASIEQHEVSGMLSEFVLNDYRTLFRKNRLKNLDILHLSFKDSFTPDLRSGDRHGLVGLILFAFRLQT